MQACMPAVAADLSNAKHGRGRQAEHAGSPAALVAAFTAKLAALLAGLAIIKTVPLPHLAHRGVRSSL